MRPNFHGPVMCTKALSVTVLNSFGKALVL